MQKKVVLVALSKTQLACIQIMKRYGNLYKEICDINNLRLAHQNAKKGKGWYKEVKMLEENLDQHLFYLQKLLIDKTYKTSPYETFVKNDSGKERLIYKLPYFPDRVCQWGLLQVIEPYLMKNLILDTYSAIPGRGIHFGLSRIKKAIRLDPDGTKYCLKFDIRKYYPSIDHSILKEKYRKVFKDPDLLWLIDEIVDSTKEETGIPIGNYLSQWSGNFYLSSFDHWVKEAKGAKHYFRYMDDIVILSGSKERLWDLFREIELHLKSELNLDIKSNHQVFPIDKRGIDFLGYRIYPDHTLLRKSTYKTLRRKMVSIKKKVDSGCSMNYTEWCQINSYNGWIKFCNGFNLKRAYIAPLLPYADDYYRREVKGKS